MGEPQDHRLPAGARPIRYEIELRPDLEAARFEGRVGIELDVLERTDRLVLHAADLTIESAQVTSQEGRSQPAEFELSPADERLVLRLDQPVEGRCRLAIAYRGELNDRLLGFYRSSFRDPSGAERLIATTQFESTHARRAFPCWDEPEYKAVFSVTLVVEPGLTGISNGRLLSSTTAGDGRQVLRFEDTMVMSTYLVAFVVGPYEWSETRVVDGVPIRIAAVTGKSGMTGYALDVAAHSLHFLAGYFGIPYPGGKLDHVGVPDFAFGAMENLGCAIYRENLLLTDPDVASQAELQQLVRVIAHETSHMWFGDLVTMKWWDGIWLNEAFATFMEQTTADAFRPDWDIWTAAGLGTALALVTDGLKATRPVEYPVGHPAEAEGMFDVLTYQKGGAVLKMLEQYLGPQVFRRGISRYLATHAYANTETADLWAALEAESGEPVGQIMTTWIRQGGYPLVSAATADPSTVVLRQKRFLYDPTGSGDRWVVPVNLRASVGGRVHHERVLLAGEEISHRFPGPVEWLVVNDGAWGFYRSGYSPELWSALMRPEALGTLAARERLQLLGDTWAAVAPGEVELSRWAQAAAAVAGEPDPDVWASLAGALATLDRIAGGPGSPDRVALAGFARRLAEPAWADVGWEAAPGESDRVGMARGRILRVLAELGEDEALAGEARRRFTAHLASPGRDVLAPDLVSAAAQVTVARGGPAEWEMVLDAYHSSSQPQERLRFLYALCETLDPDLRRRTLEFALGPEVRPQDAYLALLTVMSRRGAETDGWEWFEANWPRIEERIPRPLLIRSLEAVTAYTDGELAGRVRRFCAARDLHTTPIRVEQVLERMDISVALARRLRGTLAAGLA